MLLFEKFCFELYPNVSHCHTELLLQVFYTRFYKRKDTMQLRRTQQPLLTLSHVAQFKAVWAG